MSNKYKIKDIIEAVDILLGQKNKILKLENEVKKTKPSILKLVDEVRNNSNYARNVPDNTEKIILQAEKYLKK